MRRARHSEPGQMLSEFLESAYVAAAELGGWDRAALKPVVTTRVGRTGQP
ncbi:DUF5996 family protein [Micromonospora sp. NPDC050200]